MAELFIHFKDFDLIFLKYAFYHVTNIGNRSGSPAEESTELRNVNGNASGNPITAPSTTEIPVTQTSPIPIITQNHVTISTSESQAVATTSLGTSHSRNVQISDTGSRHPVAEDIVINVVEENVITATEEELKERPNEIKKSSATSTNGEVTPLCRICYDYEIELPGRIFEKPVYACRCRGTVGLVHLSCLQKWLTISQTARCELCHYQFPTQEILRYGRFKSIGVWFKHVVDKAQLMFDICAWLVMTPIIAVLIGLALVSSQWLQVAKHRLPNPPPAAHYAIIFGLTSLVLVGCCAYVLWQLKVIWSYYLTWYRFYHGPQNRMVVLKAFAQPVPIDLTDGKSVEFEEEYRESPLEIRMEYQRNLYREIDGMVGETSRNRM